MSMKVIDEYVDFQKFVGTPVYMAPEMLLEQIYCKKCDIWSAGCTFFHLFTGKRPYMNIEKFQDLESTVEIKNPLEACDDETLNQIK
mmetsp:Transcript_41004/g.36361  ORF Transcript_41004/g.36361 Transcript_41004/m.36361 type:complete len:87 (+) Transcript_41004:148-408(+)